MVFSENLFLVCDIDHIPIRCVIDEVKNQHGSCFIDFLLESKMCLVNGRISPENNDFTNVSKKGKSVVDYIVVPHENLSSCVHFSVTSCNDILSDFNLVHLIGNNSKVPDHSLLSLTVETSMVIINDKRIAMDHVRPQNINTVRYSFKNVPNEYMNSEAFRELASKFLVDIDLCRDTLPCVDTLYNNFIKLLQVEMDDHLRRINFNKAKLDRYNYFWNDELQKLWKDKKIAEKEFRKCKKHDYKDKYLLFKLACNIFDKKFRQYERHYKYTKSVEIEQLQFNNPNQFWKEIKNLGPKSHKNIPMEIYSTNDAIVTDYLLVTNKWKHEFESLYQITLSLHNFEKVKKVQQFNYMIEMNMNDPLYVTHSNLDYTFSTQELKVVISNAKAGKSPGPDNIPNEILKYEILFPILHKAFNLFYDYGLTPST